jgi:hypothetical protein
MSSLKIDIDRLNAITAAHERDFARLPETRSAVAAARYGLDSRIQGRRNIGTRMQMVYNNLLETEIRLNRLKIFVQQSSDLYTGMERKISEQANAVGQQVAIIYKISNTGASDMNKLASYMRDEWMQDETVRRLVGQAMIGSSAEQAEALALLESIFKARLTIARAQAAYEAYKAFGNTALMDLAHAEAEKQRQKLKTLGVDETFYGSSVNIRHLFEGTSIEAAAYDPSFQLQKNGKPVLVLMPDDNQYRYLLGLVLQGGGAASWAKLQLREIHERLAEIGRAQVAWFEYRDKNMTKEMQDAHLYANKLRLQLINKYGLSAEWVEKGDFKNWWVGDGLAGKHHVQEKPVNAQPVQGQSSIPVKPLTIRTTDKEYIELVGQIISANEGDYGSVNPKDGSGTKSTPYSLSVGKLQWYAERAHDLLRKIVESNPEQAKKILDGTTLYQEIMGDRSNFHARPLQNKKEIDAISRLLSTPEGKRIQDETKASDVAGYIRAGEKLGITDPQTLAYFADLYNQRPASANEIVALAGGGAGLTLSRIHEIALNHPIMGKYASRRKNAYELSLKIATGNDGGSSGSQSAASPNKGSVTGPVEVDNGQLVLPTEAWQPAVPRYTATGPEDWQAETYNKIIDQFQVTSESRYLPKNKFTYCNIFVWDVTSAMGREIPHWVNKNTGEPVVYGSSQFNQLYKQGKVQELNANMTFDWLAKHGSEYGWKQVTGKEAQAAANQGIPAVAVWKNPNASASGHIAIVRPFDASKPTGKNGIYIAQAGASNFDYKDIGMGFSSKKLEDIVYYIAV